MGGCNNETLEFLGDSILNFVVTEYIFKQMDFRTEGEMSSFRAQIVSHEPLVKVALSLGLDKFILLGKGEEKTGGRARQNTLEDTMEAVVAAVFLSNDMETTKEFVLRVLADVIEEAKERPTTYDYKTALTLLAKQEGFGIPEYTFSCSGRDHQKTFHADVAFSKSTLFSASATGSSKTKASLQAAKIAFDKINASLVHKTTQPAGVS
jgi:ribonuclease-3